MLGDNARTDFFTVANPENKGGVMARFSTNSTKPEGCMLLHCD